MTKQVRRVAAALGLAALIAITGGAGADAQNRLPGPRVRAAQRQQGLAVQEVERLFDGYVAMQAQDSLKLTDAQFPPFLTKLKVLQETRRRYLQERRRLVASLSQLLRERTFREAVAREALTNIRDLDSRSSDEIQKAREAVDQVLDVSQQARFRVFEEMLELRKLELVARARRNARERAPGRQPER